MRRCLYVLTLLLALLLTSSTVLVKSFTATGGSLTPLTVTVINADAVPPLPSLML